MKLMKNLYFINNFSKPNNYQNLSTLPNSVTVPIPVPVQVPVPLPIAVSFQVPYIEANAFQGSIYNTPSIPVYQSAYL